jgi:hypothetical protein
MAITMTQKSARPRRRDALRALDVLGSVWSATATAPVAGGTAAAYRTLVRTTHRLLAGRRVAVRLDDGVLAMTVARLAARPDGARTGVHLVAHDIRWRTTRIDRATVLAEDVHLSPGAPPLLVAEAVEVTFELSPPALEDLLRGAAPRLTGDVGPDGVARLHLANRPAWGHLEVEASVDGSTLCLRARRVVAGRLRVRLPVRAPAYRVALPEIAHGLQLTGVEFAPGLVRVSGTLARWQVELPRKSLEDMVGQLGVAGLALNLTRLARPR